MPELPEVETTARKLQPLIGKEILSFKSDWPRGLKIGTPVFVVRDIGHRKILSVSRIAKTVLFRLSPRRPGEGERLMAFHQRMSGKLVIVAPQTVSRYAKKHVRVRIDFKDRTTLLFIDPRKFGVVWYGVPEKVMKDAYFAKLGADALSVSFGEFCWRLKKHKGMIKPLLLRQDVLAGIGNIVADEMLWEAKIHPERMIATLGGGEIKALFNALKAVLARSIRAQGTTLRDWGHPDGEEGNFQNHLMVYGRKEQRCRRCKNKIMRIVVGGRGTWVCGKCQQR